MVPIPATFRLVYVLTLVALTSACANPKPIDMTPDQRRDRIEQLYAGYRKDFPDAPEVNVQDVLEMKQKEAVVLVDAREPQERAVSVIPGAVPKERVLADEKNFEGKPLVVYCTIGYRSGLLTEHLRDDGLDAYNLKGSILAWVDAGQPVVDPDGNETKRVHTYGRRWALLPEGYEAIY